MISLDDDELDKYIRAGRIAAEALKIGKKTCSVGVPYFHVVKAVEQCIRDEGAFPAFPVNVSVNNIGAHYTPYPGDEKTFKPGDVVKIDVGCHIDGYIADTASTVEVETNIHKNMITAAEEALGSAIKMVRPGIKVRELGATIEDTINGFGFKPIRNLTGHRLEQYVLHSGLSIPNISSGRGVLREGMVVAIEPFATNGMGKVANGQKSEIYILRRNRRLDKEESDLYQWLYEKFNSLPFASYWCHPYSDDYHQKLLRLERRGAVMSYPLLIEESNGIVTQREHTVLVSSKGPRILTE